MRDHTFSVPLPADLTGQLIRFWQDTFDSPYASFHDLLVNGAEQAHNHETIYLAQDGAALAGTCHLTVPTASPHLGGLGEVATADAYRRQGIASRLCQQARDDFRQQGGLALFLGTHEGTAARVYYRLGYRKLAGSHIMANITNGDAPEAFLVDFFRAPGASAVRDGSAADRIPIIPLLGTPHDWHILDANVPMVSTRYAVQKSCMGLYPRYATVAADGRGAWFSAYAGDDRIVGLATARLADHARAQVDGFTHARFADAWTPLIEQAMAWAAARGVNTISARVCVEDEERQALFAGLGFRAAGKDAPFDIEGRDVPSIRMERAAR